MSSILVRDLDDKIIGRLKAIAKNHGRSLQGEVKAILTDAISFLSMEEAEDILKDFMRFPIQTHGPKLLLNSAWSLAKNSGATIYNSLYLALANSKECPLVTADNKFYQAIKSCKETTNSRIVWVEDVRNLEKR